MYFIKSLAVTLRQGNTLTQLRCTDIFYECDFCRLYQNVRIIGIVPGKTLDYVIQFDIKPFKKVRWQSSKRLIFGSLVCLSDDHFDTVFFAVITKREDEKIENGVIHVCFETQTGEVLGLSSSRLFTMVESVSFFEANRHVLEGLKQMKDMVPMSHYIVECQQKVNPPSYLKTPGEQVTMNLTALTGTTRYVNVENVPVIDFDAWPEVDWKLNQSQVVCIYILHVCNGSYVERNK